MEDTNLILEALQFYYEDITFDLESREVNKETIKRIEDLITKMEKAA